MAVQMQQVHAELKAQVWGPWSQHLSSSVPNPQTASPTRLLGLWDYEASLTIQVSSGCCVYIALHVPEKQHVAGCVVTLMHGVWLVRGRISVL